MMSVKMKIPLKIFLFFVFFFLLSVCASFFFRDDSNSYARALFHEFYAQERIDYLICGASHVSHGVEANTAGGRFGKSVFNTGTPSQKIDGTYAILRQALKLYKIEKVFLELDFAVACAPAFSERTGLTSEYIVSENLRDFGVKYDFLLHCSAPSHYLNSFLPIGKDKLITLNPKKIARKLASVADGSYFKYSYHDDGSEYAGRGCVLDFAEIPDGGFSDCKLESAIPVERVSDDWKGTVEKIISLCRENGVELIFYAMPNSDFYLNQKGNYDSYYAFCKNFINEHGFAYYDFNLAKPELLSLSDSDYHDDNHLSKKGVYKWTDVFCDFFSEKYKEENVIEKCFYPSYAEKMKDVGDRVFGLYMIESGDKKTLEITPVTNIADPGRITYDVYAVSGGEETVLAKDSGSTTVSLPLGKSGKIRVVSYLDGIKQNDCMENFAAF